MKELRAAILFLVVLPLALYFVSRLDEWDTNHSVDTDSCYLPARTGLSCD